MYAPHPFKVTDLTKIIPFVQHHSLANIVSPGTPYPFVSHIPLMVKQREEKVKLIGHFSRANPQVKALQTDPEVVAIFSGAQSYISAYAKDPEHLSIIPTWDYQFVHASGTLTFLDEAALLESLKTMMHFHESSQPKAMNLNHYPQDTLRKKLKAIIGFEIEVFKWEACFRLNQNRTPDERAHIKSHLKENKDLINAIDEYDPTSS